MTPLPDNPIIVLRVTKDGSVEDNRNNIGNDLKIVVVWDKTTFAEESAGVPYVGKVE
jgi:hypothetical protein